MEEVYHSRDLLGHFCKFKKGDSSDVLIKAYTEFLCKHPRYTSRRDKLNARVNEISKSFAKANVNKANLWNLVTTLMKEGKDGILDYLESSGIKRVYNGYHQKISERKESSVARNNGKFSILALVYFPLVMTQYRPPCIDISSPRK